MLLRIRVRLPDRPGSLGKVARTLGAAGTDVVQMAVLEREGGRALDDFTVVWPSGTGIERLCDGLAYVPGVEIIGIWPTAEPQGAFPDAVLIGQLAARPDNGLAILADAVPAILSADWAGLLRPPRRGQATSHRGEQRDEPGEPGEPGGGPFRSAPRPPSEPGVLVHTSIGAFADIEVPDVHPLRPRAFTGTDGTQYAVAPIRRGALVLLVARGSAPPFHRTEVFRIAQLVGAAEAVLGERCMAAASKADIA